MAEVYSRQDDRCPKVESAIQNARIIQSMLGEQPSRCEILRAWMQLLRLPVESSLTSREVVGSGMFAVQGVIRVQGGGETTNRMDGLEVYLGYDCFISLESLCDGRVGRILLREFFKLENWSGVLETLVKIELKKLTMPKTIMEDFFYLGFHRSAYEQSHASQKEAAARNTCVVQHKASRKMLTIDGSTFFIQLTCRAVLDKKFQPL